MRRCLYLLPLLIFSIAAFGFSRENLNDKNHSLNFSPTATPTPTQTEESDEIVLDKKVACQPCPPEYRCLPNPNCPDANSNMTIAVSAVKPKNDQLKYEYTVSGGRVIGGGAEVLWDLTGAQPGTYQIKVDIEDKSTGKKQTETETIAVEYFKDGGDCSCPTLTVKALKPSIKAGETVTFVANIEGGSEDRITYNWKISAGEIIEGQGTPIIRVATNFKMASKTVKATVEMEGVCEVCPKTESADARIVETKTTKKRK